MRVLRVEGDPMIGDAIQGALKDASYAADWIAAPLRRGVPSSSTLGLMPLVSRARAWSRKVRASRKPTSG